MVRATITFVNQRISLVKSCIICARASASLESFTRRAAKGGGTKERLLLLNADVDAFLMSASNSSVVRFGSVLNIFSQTFLASSYRCPKDVIIEAIIIPKIKAVQTE
jgi:hypothetical protein